MNKQCKDFKKYLILKKNQKNLMNKNKKNLKYNQMKIKNKLK